jgi:hypothetical protein
MPVILVRTSIHAPVDLCFNLARDIDFHVQSIGEPQCDFGRGPEECIPGALIRTNDFLRIGVNKANGHLYVTWQDFRNGEYDIQMARSDLQKYIRRRSNDFRHNPLPMPLRTKSR